MAEREERRSRIAVSDRSHARNTVVGRQLSLSVLTEHLVVRDGAISINVVELERPAQLLVEPSSRSNAECADEFLKVDGTVLVLVEHVEDVFCKS